MTNVALLSHRGGNIGHDFMSLGIEVAVREAFGNDAHIDYFEQHNPFEVYPPGHWLRLMHRVRHGRLGFVRRVLNTTEMRRRLWPTTAPLDYDIAIACGGPNIVPGGSKAAELGLILHHMNGAFRYRGVPLVDAGIGACFPLEHVPERLEDEADRRFYATAIGFCRSVTVRDPVAQKIMRDLGFDPLLIPCAAIGTGRVFEKAEPERGEASRYVMINFQHWGANTDWDQGVNAALWMRTMQMVIGDLEKRHPVMLLAHNGYERTLAGKLAPHLPCRLPVTTGEYARVIGMAKVGVVSRIHAAIPLAGIGVPSVVTGTDTRLGTVAQIGLPTMYVKHTTAEWIIDQVETLAAKAPQERERLIVLREDTMRRYTEVFRANLK